MLNSANPREHERISSIALLLLSAAALWCVCWFIHSWHYWEDDSYIHLEFARSLATGHGFAFNGRVVAGDTAPLWVFLLVAFHAILPKWLIAGKVLTVVGAIFGLSGIYAFARSLARDLLPSIPDNGLVPAALIVFILANPYTCYWIFSGMEPIAAAGLACFALLAATRPRPGTRNFLIACLLVGLAPLLRPEMLFLSALLAFPLISQARRLSSNDFAARIAGIILACTPVVLWSLYSLHVFGHLLPNTDAAKRAAPGHSVPLHLLTIYSFGLPLILAGFIVGIAYLVLRPASVRHSIRTALTSFFTGSRENSNSLPLAGWIFILWSAITTVFYIANHTYVQTRYILVTAPGLTIIILILALRASRRAGHIAYGAGFVAALVVTLFSAWPFVRNKGLNCEAADQIARYLHDHLPPDAPVAVYSIGEISFVSEHPIIDTGGITRPDAIPYLNAPAAMLEWAHSQGAQYFIGDKPEPDAVLVYNGQQRFATWSIHPSRYNTAIPIQLWRLSSTPRTSNAIP